MQHESPDRRSFLATTVTATAALATSNVLAPSRVLGANERLRIATIGCGGRGTYLQTLVHDFSAKHNVEIAAVCDVWKPAREKITALAYEEQGSKPKAFRRYRDMLAMKDVDAVLIATADHAHARILTEAAMAGKHAYCEKPMSSNLADANAAVDAVEANGVICQVGTQRRSHIPHQQAVELVRSGVIGAISEIETSYNRCTPSWKRGFSDVRKEDVDWEQYLMYLPMREFDPQRYRCWHLYRDYSIGLAGLLGAHVIDVGPWFMDDPLPESAVGMGDVLVWKDGRENCDTMESIFMYPRGFMLRFVSRLGNSAGGSEVKFRGTKGSFDTATLTATGEGGGKGALKEPITVKGQSDYLAWSDARPLMENWLECIRSGEKPNADVHAGYSHSLAAIMAHEAIDQGRKLRFDPVSRAIL